MSGGMGGVGGCSTKVTQGGDPQQHQPEVLSTFHKMRARAQTALSKESSRIE